MRFKKLLSFLILFGVFTLSVIKINVKEAPEETDKFVHIIMYFFVAYSFKNLKVKNYALISILYGILIEIIQFFIPYRSFSFGDIIANSIGVGIFLVFIKMKKGQSPF